MWSCQGSSSSQPTAAGEQWVQPAWWEPPGSRLPCFHWDASAATLVRAAGKPASKPETGPWKTSLLQTGAVTTEASTDHLVGRTTKGREDPEQDCFLKKSAWPSCPHRGQHRQAPPSALVTPNPPDLSGREEGIPKHHTPTLYCHERDYVFAEGFSLLTLFAGNWREARRKKWWLLSNEVIEILQYIKGHAMAVFSPCVSIEIMKQMPMDQGHR